MLKEKLTEVVGNEDPYQLGEIPDEALKLLLLRFDESTAASHFAKADIRRVVTRLIPTASSNSFNYYLYKSIVISDAEPDKDVNKKTLSYSKGQVLAVLALLYVRQRMGGRRLNRGKDGIVERVMQDIGQDHPLLQFFSKIGSGGLQQRERNWDELIEEEVDKKQGRKDEGFSGFSERDATFLRKIDGEEIRGWLDATGYMSLVEKRDTLDWQRLRGFGINIEGIEVVERALLLILNGTARINALDKFGAFYEQSYRKIEELDTFELFIKCLNLVDEYFNRYDPQIKDLHRLALAVNKAAEQRHSSIFDQQTNKTPISP